MRPAEDGVCLFVVSTTGLEGKSRHEFSSFVSIFHQLRQCHDARNHPPTRYVHTYIYICVHIHSPFIPHAFRNFGEVCLDWHLDIRFSTLTVAAVVIVVVEGRRGGESIGPLLINSVRTMSCCVYPRQRRNNGRKDNTAPLDGYRTRPQHPRAPTNKGGLPSARNCFYSDVSSPPAPPPNCLRFSSLHLREH